MNLAGRLQGSFFSPTPTFKAIAEKPKWVDAFVVVLIFVAIAAYLTAPFASQDSLKAMKDNVKLEEKMGINASETREIVFNNCEVPRENLLEGEGAGIHHDGLGHFVAAHFDHVDGLAVSGQHQVDRSGTEKVERLLAAGHLLNLPVFAFEETGQVSQDYGVGIDEQQAAGAQNISTL